MHGWELEERLGIRFQTCQYPDALRTLWEAERERIKNSKGGVVAQQLPDLAQLVWQQIWPLVAEHRFLYEQEKTAHAKTVQLLGQVCKGDIPIDRVKVSDEGWQVLPEPPAELEPESVVKPKSKKKKSKKRTSKKEADNGTGDASAIPANEPATI